MVDFKQQLVSALSAITAYPIHYEKFNKPETIPCITYREIENVDNLVGDTLEYSFISFELRIYTTNLTDLGAISTLVDAKMKDLGFRRYLGQESSQDNYNIKVLRYVANGYYEV